MLLHDGLRFRNEPAAAANIVTKEVGNVTVSSELTLEFGVRPSDNNRPAARGELSFFLCLRALDRAFSVLLSGSFV